MFRFRVTAVGVVAAWLTAVAFVAPANATVAPHSVPFASKLTAEYQSTCAVTTSHLVECWGANNMRQLGTGDTAPGHTPRVVESVDHAIAVTSAYDASCALSDYGTTTAVWCWGAGYSHPYAPTSITGFPAKKKAVAVATERSYGCALISDGTVYCWGSNESSSKLLTGVVQIAAGDTSTCALLSNATVKCWGKNNTGQLGNGSLTDSVTPVAVHNLSGVAAISVGYGTACALLSGGTAKCWGDNEGHQLGNGSNITLSTLPVTVSSISHATAITTGAFDTCALFAGGTAKCWGKQTYGDLDNGKDSDASVPTAVKGLTGIVAMGLGWFHTCAMFADGSAKCFGSNISGQLGTGGLTPSPTPVSVVGL